MRMAAALKQDVCEDRYARRGTFGVRERIRHLRNDCGGGMQVVTNHIQGCRTATIAPGGRLSCNGRRRPEARWLDAQFIQEAKPVAKAYIERFKGRLRDERMNGHGIVNTTRQRSFACAVLASDCKRSKAVALCMVGP